MTKLLKRCKICDFDEQSTFIIWSSQIASFNLSSNSVHLSLILFLISFDCISFLCKITDNFRNSFPVIFLWINRKHLLCTLQTLFFEKCYCWTTGRSGVNISGRQVICFMSCAEYIIAVTFDNLCYLSILSK